MLSFRETAATIGCILRTVREDDKIHRCATELHPKSDNGSYRTDGERGWVKNWETGTTATWHREAREEAIRSPPRPLPSLALRRSQEDERARLAASVASQRLKSAATAHHEYLARKGFPKQFGLVEGELLLVPAYIGREVSSLQEITPAGVKKNLPGGKMGGAVCSFGNGRLEILCEGYATGLSIKAALAGLCVQGRVTCCFSASNIAVVARARRHALVIADHDRPIEQLGGVGTGEFYARKSGLPWAMPPVPGDANDLHQAAGLPALQRVLLDLMTRKRQAA